MFDIDITKYRRSVQKLWKWFLVLRSHSLSKTSATDNEPTIYESENMSHTLKKWILDN